VEVPVPAGPFYRPIQDAGASLAVVLPRPGQTPARGAEVVVAAATVKDLFPEVAEVRPAGPGLVGGVEVVGAPEPESGQPVRLQAEPVFFLRIFGDPPAQVAVTGGAESVVGAVRPPVLKHFRRVEPVPASWRTGATPTPAFAETVEI
jgi:hypothetical protein